MNNIINTDKNSIVNVNTPLTMSSREIAELCSKQHKHVMRDIENMLVEINEPKNGPVDFKSNYTDKKGEKRPCYNLPKRECLILVSGYNAQLRAKIIDRWIELEKRNHAKHPDFAAVLSDPQHLQVLLLDNVTKVIELEQKVAEQAPKVEAYEHLTRADGTMCITDAAKALEVRPKDLFAYMLQNSWVYRRQGGGSLIPYQDKIQRGLLDCSTTTVYKSDGTEKITTQTRVTPKGLAQLEQNYKELVV